ncbi:hypothetical protein SS1G_08311 [Sclerotinia sclerotiorum 1980 UF-70]|uniref:Uncharacterized protein n=1 Tax=Sclerotinia sclerotiorum (strain ATCC 18683 / 1980 / Ss-1) TaxID=665079 RepID=A7ESK6_SCLS1|nr:hypothetical protein SS1G_08311 [Sclerotinia sclerotiorum 1980 UF-70]EDN92448.1 hypothetical protein SS1G_08311 [Sclerotinia sclerotiorum 1980 UF-70]
MHNFFAKLPSTWLELGNYSFSHDWQLDWILSHGETLQVLILDFRPIVSVLRHRGEIMWHATKSRNLGLTGRICPRRQMLQNPIIRSSPKFYYW